MPHDKTTKNTKQKPAPLAPPSGISIFEGLMDEVDQEVEKIQKLEEEAEKKAQQRA